MTTIEHNGENWYTDKRSIARRCLEWIWSKPRKALTPMSFFGHRLTFYGWGADLKTSRGSLVVSRPHGHSPNWRAYHSANGTPDQAFTWFFGAPREVREQAASRVRTRAYE